MVSGKIKKPILLATLGYPGSGKTFFARRFAKDLWLFHLNSDRLRLEIFPRPSYTAAENSIVFRMMDYIADELLRNGISVIYDANLTKRVYRKRLKQIAKKRKAGYLLLWFKTPLRRALDRIKKRTKLKSEIMKKYHRPISSSVLLRIRADEESLIREPHIILGAGSYKKQKDMVLKFLQNNKFVS